VQRRRDCARLHVEGFGNRVVVEVGVVAEEEGKPLPLRKRCDERFECSALAVAVLRGCAARRMRNLSRPPLQGTPSRGLVDDDPEEPSFAGAARAEATPVPQRPHERVVDGLLRELLIPQDCDGDAQESAVTGPVDALDFIPVRYFATTT
jgi:hypothetical protein